MKAKVLRRICSARASAASGYSHWALSQMAVDNCCFVHVQQRRDDGLARVEQLRIELVRRDGVAVALAAANQALQQRLTQRLLSAPSAAVQVGGSTELHAWLAQGTLCCIDGSQFPQLTCCR